MTLGYLRIPTYASVADYSQQIKDIKLFLPSQDDNVIVENASNNSKLDQLKDVLKKLQASTSVTKILVTWDLNTLSAPGNDIHKSNLLKLLQLINWMLDKQIKLVLANPDAPEIDSSVWRTLLRYHTAIISEGKTIGASRAKARGQRLGRPTIEIDTREMLKTVARHNLTKAAKMLGVSRATLRDRMKKVQSEEYASELS